MPLPVESTRATPASVHLAAEHIVRIVETALDRNLTALTRTAGILEAGGFDATDIRESLGRERRRVRYLRAWLGDPQAPLDRAPADSEFGAN